MIFFARVGQKKLRQSHHFCDSHTICVTVTQILMKSKTPPLEAVSGSDKCADIGIMFKHDSDHPSWFLSISEHSIYVLRKF